MNFKAVYPAAWGHPGLEARHVGGGGGFNFGPIGAGFGAGLGSGGFNFGGGAGLGQQYQYYGTPTVYKQYYTRYNTILYFYLLNQCMCQEV